MVFARRVSPTFVLWLNNCSVLLECPDSMIRQSDKNAIFWFATVLIIIQRCPEQHSPLTHRCPRHRSAWFSALVDSAHLCLYWLFSLLLRKSLQTVMFDRENVWMAVIVDYYLYYNGCNECICCWLSAGGRDTMRSQSSHYSSPMIDY